MRVELIVSLIQNQVCCQLHYSPMAAFSLARQASTHGLEPCVW